MKKKVIIKLATFSVAYSVFMTIMGVAKIIAWHHVIGAYALSGLILVYSGLVIITDFLMRIKIIIKPKAK